MAAVYQQNFFRHKLLSLELFLRLKKYFDPFQSITNLSLLYKFSRVIFFTIVVGILSQCDSRVTTYWYKHFIRSTTLPTRLMNDIQINTLLIMNIFSSKKGFHIISYITNVISYLIFTTIFTFLMFQD